MMCNNCMWAIWDYAKIECVACMADADDKCPTSEDIATANKGGYLAFYGCSKDDEE